MSLRLKIFSCVCLAACFSVCMSDDPKFYGESVDDLKDNIKKLQKAKLEFSDDKTAYFHDELPSSVPKNHSEWDFVIVGAGSAGSVLASRLSEIEDVSVLLIEAGSKEYPIMDIPTLPLALQLSDQVNWMYETEPSDSYCLGMEGSKCRIPRGKVMGGSSVLNFMLATRGSTKDFDHWANVTGDSSWSYDEMLRYFKELENFQVEGIEENRKYHNYDGPVHISGPPFQTELGEAFFEAGRELDFHQVDYNGPKQTGFGGFQATTKNGERWSTNRAYLHPIGYRKNLVLTRNSRVDKVLIDPLTRQALGVQFKSGDQTIHVKAKKEIILSAGAINSPQILMLSGVGPAAHLQELGIKVIRDALVGENFMDHVAYGGLIFKVNDSETYKEYEANILDPRNPALETYVANRTGMMALCAGFEALFYVNADDPVPSNEDPNIELLFGASSGLKDPLFQMAEGIKEEYQKKMKADKFNHSAWSTLPMLMYPKSRGKLLLRSKDPEDKPLLYPNYFGHREDVETLIKGIRFIMKLSQTDAMRKFGSEFYEFPVPCDQHVFDSDEYWECAMRAFTLTVYHQSGTCKMGRRHDRTAVVDPELRVIGIEGLRVSDASIMPRIVSGHPNLAVIAVAEKTADLIKTHWGYDQSAKNDKSCKFEM